MTIRNFLKLNLVPEQIHEGEGLCPHTQAMPANLFQTPVRFVNYTILPPGASIGAHEHGNDNEMYICLEGSGEYEMNGERAKVEAGDIMLNEPFATHALFNTGANDMRLLVIEVYND